MVIAQEKVIRTESFWQNQVLFRRYTAVDGALKKEDRHGGVTSLTIPTDGLVDRFWTGFRACYATTFIYLLRSNVKNWPQGNHGKSDGALWPRGTPIPYYQEIGKRERVCACRRAVNWWHDNGVQRDNRFVADGHLSRGYMRSETTNHRPQDMGHFQDIFTPRPLWTKEIGHCCRQRGIHSGGTKYLQCTATPSRRASRGNRQLEY